MRENFSDPVEWLTLYHLRSLTPLRSSPRAAGALDALYGRVTTVRDGIRAEEYPPPRVGSARDATSARSARKFKEVPGTERDRLILLVDRFRDLRDREQKLNAELEATAGELHRAAEQLGLHRIPGTREVAIRRREETWRFDAAAVDKALAETGVYGAGRRLRRRRGAEARQRPRALRRDPGRDRVGREPAGPAGTWELER